MYDWDQRSQITYYIPFTCHKLFVSHLNGSVSKIQSWISYACGEKRTQGNLSLKKEKKRLIRKWCASQLFQHSLAYNDGSLNCCRIFPDTIQSYLKMPVLLFWGPVRLHSFPSVLSLLATTAFLLLLFKMCLFICHLFPRIHIWVCLRCKAACEVYKVQKINKWLCMDVTINESIFSSVVGHFFFGQWKTSIENRIQWLTHECTPKYVLWASLQKHQFLDVSFIRSYPGSCSIHVV